MGKNFLKSSLQNASFNIIFQLVFRVVTFLLNAFVLRNISQAVVGVMNVRLLLLESTILFLSREAFRRACLSKTTEHNWPQVVNLIWLTVPLCAVLSILFGWIWLYALTTPEQHITTHYTIGVWSICISCIMEMCIEPIFLVSQAFLFVKLKVLLDTLHVVIRTITFTSLVLWKPSAAVLAFSVAQLLAVGVFCLAYIVYFHHFIQTKSPTEDFPFSSMKDFLPKKLDNEELVDLRLCVLTWSFLKQGILKQVLTEGERYIMTLFSVLTFYEQGIYDVVNNLGSLAARFIFRPVEESSYFYFSQLVHRDKSIKEQNEEQMKEAATVLKQLLRCMSSLGLLIVCFGQGYSRLLLLLYGGQTLADDLGTLLLRTHCFAVLLLGLNGISECYALATMSASQLDRYNYVMAFLSVGFLFFSLIFTYVLGSVGFIIANCGNMLARIFHSLKFIKKRYTGSQFDPVKGIVPGKLYLFTVATSGVITLMSENFYYENSKVYHFFIGALCFLVTVGVWIFEEKAWVLYSYKSIRRHSLKLE
ncbi:man(5)GlcNAc(2)-PP-dolichol translocation protein RFT1 isoform X1 [Halyomorpha halys]|uniref:man(5)GlcNAc(2)-PP-dolichol translocation protein RFT1 isoform X1 n=2 Tax=Halyomorpha halys TaxID=286706 RepID=UPI0006D50CE2|nr:protein RFT1 homolog isoform X1 [Halyomorpha halys]